jgi:dynein light intermediate chain 1, cytosolic
MWQVQSYLQHYTEPSADPIPAATTIATQVPLLPLGPGSLTRNSSGASIIVVCTKADLIDGDHEGVPGIGGMVKGKGGEWEEKTDAVMQILRTICLSCMSYSTYECLNMSLMSLFSDGAALFYTTQMPTTLSVLRQYALHMLFIPPAPQPGMASSTEASAPIRNPFPFSHKSNTLDRDRIVVPAGWDSWGKITVMREFDPKSWVELWERDVDDNDDDGAKASFAALITDQGAKVCRWFDSARRVFYSLG